MPTDYTPIYNLLEEAESHRKQIAILQGHVEALTKTAQSKCEHPATFTRIVSGGEASKITCMICNRVMFE